MATEIKLTEEKLQEYAAELVNTMSEVEDCINKVKTAEIENSVWIGPTKRKYDELLNELVTKCNDVNSLVEHIKTRINDAITGYSNLNAANISTFTEKCAEILADTNSVVGNEWTQ